MTIASTSHIILRPTQVEEAALSFLDGCCTENSAEGWLMAESDYEYLDPGVTLI